MPCPCFPFGCAADWSKVLSETNSKVPQTSDLIPVPQFHVDQKHLNSAQLPFSEDLELGQMF